MMHQSMELLEISVPGVAAVLKVLLHMLLVFQEPLPTQQVRRSAFPVLQDTTATL